MHAHHVEERLAIDFVTGEGPSLGDARRLQVGLAGHQRGDGRRIVAAVIAVVGMPSDISSAPGWRSPSRAGDSRGVVAIFFGRIGGVADDDFLRRDHDSTAAGNASISNGRLLANFIRFSDARLQAESSRNMYSEHGLEALMRRGVFATYASD